MSKVDEAISAVFNQSCVTETHFRKIANVPASDKFYGSWRCCLGRGFEAVCGTAYLSHSLFLFEGKNVSRKILKSIPIYNIVSVNEIAHLRVSKSAKVTTRNGEMVLDYFSRPKQLREFVNTFVRLVMEHSYGLSTTEDDSQICENVF